MCEGCNCFSCVCVWLVFADVVVVGECWCCFLFVRVPISMLLLLLLLMMMMMVMEDGIDNVMLMDDDHDDNDDGGDVAICLGSSSEGTYVVSQGLREGLRTGSKAWAGRVRHGVQRHQAGGAAGIGGVRREENDAKGLARARYCRPA